MKSYALSYHNDVIVKRTSYMLLLMIAVLLGSYIYFVNGAIFKIVAWQSAEKQISALGPAVGLLEANYLALERTVTMAKAATLNFQDAANPEFISRKPLGNSLSIRNDL